MFVATGVAALFCRAAMMIVALAALVLFGVWYFASRFRRDKATKPAKRSQLVKRWSGFDDDARNDRFTETYVDYRRKRSNRL
jgi:hypothetical protein